MHWKSDKKRNCGGMTIARTIENVDFWSLSVVLKTLYCYYYCLSARISIAWSSFRGLQPWTTSKSRAEVEQDSAKIFDSYDDSWSFLNVKLLHRGCKWSHFRHYEVVSPCTICEAWCEYLLNWNNQSSKLVTSSNHRRNRVHESKLKI